MKRKSAPERRQKKTAKAVPQATPYPQASVSFPIVGIGASAGGLEALEHFLGHVPAGSGMAFVVVQHLDPTHKGIMCELLQRVTPMKVIQVKDRTRVRPDEIWRRDFQHGLVLLNGTRRRQTVDIGDGYARLNGEQAPRHQYILDDGGNEGFRTTGPWQELALGTKEWHAIPPYYHAWNNRCHQSTSDGGQATWDLELQGPGLYTIQAWWAAAPNAQEWTKQALYEVVAAGKVLAQATWDQSQAGDQWHTLAEGVSLDPQDKPYIRLKNSGGDTLVADALHIYSAERYNDGTPARQVTLEPMDGVILQRVETSSP